MKISIDTNRVYPILIDGIVSNTADIETSLEKIMANCEVDALEYAIKNKFLRLRIKKDSFEYHFLEKPAGVTNIHCKGADNKKKTLKFNMPYTLMVVKLKYINGKYQHQGERIFNMAEPLREDLSNKLYKWGLTNVHDSFNICWGEQGVPKDVNTNTTYRYIDDFFLGIKNNDLRPTSAFNWNNLNQDEIHEIKIEKLKNTNLKASEVIGYFKF